MALGGGAISAAQYAADLFHFSTCTRVLVKNTNKQAKNFCKVKSSKILFFKVQLPLEAIANWLWFLQKVIAIKTFNTLY